MQVFIIGSAIETAMCLDEKRLNKQIIEFNKERENYLKNK
jgi:hypothetical protein